MGLTKESQHKCGHPRIKMPEKKKKKNGTVFVIAITIIRATDQVHGFPWERERKQNRERKRETGRGASFFGSAAVDSFFFFLLKRISSRYPIWKREQRLLHGSISNSLTGNAHKHTDGRNAK